MEMRRKDRRRDEDFSLALMDRCPHGVVALQTGEDTPYCLPLSLVRVDRSLYFHCALQGRKVELMRQYPRVCVTFIDRDDPAYLEDKNEYTTYFRSVIASGTVREVTDDREKVLALRALCQKLTPQAMEGDRFDRAVGRTLRATGVWRIDLDEISGKEKAPKVN